MVKNGVVASKIAAIQETLRELRALPQLSVEALEKDFFLRRGIERSLQICVEAVIDIAHRVVSLMDEPPSASGGKALETLEARGIIESADLYRRMVQFRNIVVHHYETIDLDIVLDILQNHLGDLESFIDEISHADLGS